MASFGHVLAVIDRPLGTTLAIPATAGAGTITVDDVSRLTWPTGGMRIGSEWHTYLVDAAPDSFVDVIDADEEAEDYDEVGTLTIVPVLTNGYDVDEPVIQYQQSGVIERLATVMLPDQMEELVLRVPRGLWDRLPTGIRQRDLAPETVALEDVEGEWVLTDVVGENPLVNAAYIDPGTLPTTVPNSAGAGADNPTYFTEPWANPGRVVSANDSWATATGGSIDPPVPVRHTTGYAYPTSVADDPSVGTQNWNATSSALHAPDDVGASATAPFGLNTHYLKLTNFGFSVPTGATVTGIQVTVIRRNAGSGAVQDNLVHLVKAGSVAGSDNSNVIHWPPDFAGVAYGSSSDLWGTTWTPAQINNVGFGVAISADANADGEPRIDAVRVQVNYTITPTAHRSNTHFLMATGFGFTLPDDAVVTAIQVEVERHASDDSGDDYAVDNEVRIIAGGDVSAPIAHSAHWPTADGVATYGAQLWGLDLFPDDINSSGFGVWLSVNVNAGVTAYVDLISISVSFVGEELGVTSTDRLLEIGSGIGVIDDGGEGSPPVTIAPALLETGDLLLLETGDLVLLEDGDTSIDFNLLESGDHRLLESGDDRLLE